MPVEQHRALGGQSAEEAGDDCVTLAVQEQTGTLWLLLRRPLCSERLFFATWKDLGISLFFVSARTNKRHHHHHQWIT